MNLKKYMSFTFIHRYVAFFIALTVMTAIAVMRIAVIYEEASTAGLAAVILILLSLFCLLIYICCSSVCLSYFCYNRIHNGLFEACYFTATFAIVNFAYQLVQNGIDIDYEMLLSTAVFIFIASFFISFATKQILNKIKYQNKVSILYVLLAQTLVWIICMVLIEGLFPH